MFPLAGCRTRIKEDLRVRSQSFAGLAATQLSGFAFAAEKGGGRPRHGDWCGPGLVPRVQLVRSFRAFRSPSDLVWQE